MALLIAPFSFLSSSAAVEKNGKVRNMFNQLFSWSEGFWEVQETSQPENIFQTDLICVSVYWNFNYGRVKFLHKTRSKWSICKLSFDPSASCSSKSRFRRSTCTWSDQKQCGGQVFVETEICKKLLLEICCKRKGLQLKACCIITI